MKYLKYEIMVNLIMEDLIKVCKNKTKTKIESSFKGLFILTLDKSFFNRIELIKKLKSNEK